VQICPNCGEENPDRFRICGICGKKLVPDEIAQEVRKTVTVVFCDLKGSTSLGERLDTESLREILNVYFNEMRAVLERHGGTVEKYIGDAIMAVFGLPKLHEDDALRAVRAADEMKQALELVNRRLEKGWGVTLENRTGVNTGEVVAGDVAGGQRLVTGDTVNTAARLEQAAPALETLIGESTYRLVKHAVDVEPVEPLDLKGKAQSVLAYRLISVTRGEGVARQLHHPMVGRTSELQMLTDALERAVAERRAQLVTVIGAAGVGKSRLLQEFLARSGSRVSAVRGRCLSYGEGITFWPLADIVRHAAGITDNDSLVQARSKLDSLVGEGNRDVADRIASAIGFSQATVPIQETFWAARRLFELLARSKPALVVIDDIHWAEESFLELLEFVADSTEAPVVVVCSSRRELLEDHAEWGQERANVKRLVLDPLSEEESTSVVENLLGSAHLDEAVRTRIIGAAEGNPLFVEHMLSMLIDDGALVQDERKRWVLLSDVGTITIPPTISALLTARLDRLGVPERTVIERSAVIGQIFFRGAVEQLSPDRIRPLVGPSLRSLARKEFVRPHESIFAGQDAFRFAHILIRDAAYHGLLKRTRAELHERFVDWLEHVASDRVMEYEEIRGYHLEQAYLILVQLGPIDEHAARLGARGAEYLSSAGHRALARGDLPAAAGLLRRAATLLPVGEPTRPGLFMEAGEALFEQGEFPGADLVLGVAIEEATALGNAPLASTAELVRLHLHYATQGEVEERVVHDVDRLMPILEKAQSHEGLVRAWRVLNLVHLTAGRYSAAEQANQRIIEEAQLGGDSTLERRFLGSLAWSALYGPTPVDQAIKQCEELRERAEGDRKTEAMTCCALAHLKAMHGKFEAARDLFRHSRALFEEFGWKLDAALTSIDSGPAELLAGDPQAAESELRRDFEALDRMGERNYISTTAGWLAEAMYRQGKLDEAEQFGRFCEEVAAFDDVTSQVLWRSIQGKVLARRGRLDEGERIVRAAVDIIGRTDALDYQGNAFMDLAEVLSLEGRTEEAAMAIMEAVQLFEAKGNIVSAEHSRGALAAALVSQGDQPIPDAWPPVPETTG
jgi:class 3 adenylate cyclase/tetratricopeptide (TPR) repeat protein